MSDADVRVDGEKVQEAVLLPDSSDTPTIVTVGQVTMIVLQRESVYAVRMWDNGRSQRHTFPGRQWYPLQPSYCLTATFTPYESSATLTMNRSQGADFEAYPIGYVNFNLHGQDYCLLAFEGQSDKPFMPFRDATNGQTTYKAGRYLTAVAPQPSLSSSLHFHPLCRLHPRPSPKVARHCY